MIFKISGRETLPQASPKSGEGQGSVRAPSCQNNESNSFDRYKDVNKTRYKPPLSQFGVSTTARSPAGVVMECAEKENDKRRESYVTANISGGSNNPKKCPGFQSGIIIISEP